MNSETVAGEVCASQGKQGIQNGQIVIRGTVPRPLHVLWLGVRKPIYSSVQNEGREPHMISTSFS